jgi:SNF2 family DNA or RNA helicase
MNCWEIDNGTILLNTSDGQRYKPTASELYAQKDSESFEYASTFYAPLSSLEIRFSGLTAHPRVQICFNDTISIKLIVCKYGVENEVSLYNNVFNDYIIYNGTWRYLDTIVENVNNIIIFNQLDPKNIKYSQYVIFIRELNKFKIDYIDKVESVVDEIRGLRETDTPLGLQANLFPYQYGGSRWLDFMVNNGCGCILADEMGLGKTLQVIAVMGYIKERKENSHFLVVCPVSLLENWKREISKFYPSFTTYLHYGARRTGDYRELLKYDITIMSYSSAIADAGMLTMTNWDLLVIDEAQNIKNPRAKRTKAIKQINRDVPIAITGTPFENHMTDIWSIVDFVMPGFLGNLNQFEMFFEDDLDSAVRLEKLITPLILRRRVKDVAKDLPERVDIPQPIIMTDEEAMLYEDSRQAEEPLDELKNMQLAKIQRLRTFCTHPCVYDSDYAVEDPSSISNKYQRLCEILEEIFEKGEKVVIFTSFKKMIDMLCNDIKQRYGVYVNYIDGSVPAKERQLTIDEFGTVVGAGALVLNPKAAGAGLNITCANHAIHYNLEWNPAVEDQASARVFRRGQEKTVFVHRLYYVDTIEEIINEKIQNKRILSDNAIIGNTGSTTDQEYLIKALSASPYKH